MTDNTTVDAILEALNSAVQKKEARQLRINPVEGSLEAPFDFIAAVPATLAKHFYDMETVAPAGLTQTTRDAFGSRFPHFFQKMLGEGGVQKVLGAIVEAHGSEPKYLYSASSLYACTKDFVVMIAEQVQPATQSNLS